MTGRPNPTVVIPELPAAVEQQVVDVLFGPWQQRRVDVERLCAAHPRLAAAILAYVDAYQRVEAADSTALPTWLRPQRPPDTEPLPDSIGPYRVLSRLGAGAFGAVYLAVRERPHLRVAVKVLHAGLDPGEFLRRFDLEQQALAMMEHSNIARFHGCGVTADERPWFAMEYVEGTPISRYCAEHRLDVEQRLRLVLQVCAGVEHAHRKAIIHRDLKPSNVLVGTQESQPKIKIIDFGLSRPMSTAAGVSEIGSRAGTFLGTPGYASPEQISDPDAVDTRSDVFAIGVLLYELLTGTLPSAGQVPDRAGGLPEPERPSRRARSSRASLAGVGFAPAAASTVVRQLRGDLDWVVMKALASDPRRRYGSARELGDDIDRYLGRRPVSAGPPSLGYRARKFAQRHRMQVVAAGLVAAIVGVAVVAWVVESQRARRSERELAATVARFDLLANVARLGAVQDGERDLYPGGPDKVAAARDWLYGEVAALRAALPAIEAGAARREGAAGAERFLAEALQRAATGIRQLEVEAVPRVEAMLRWSERVVELTVDRHRRAWERARRAIAAADGVTASALYRQQPVDLQPQIGLVPIGRNPVTGLWEFYHLRSAWDPAGGGDPAALALPEHRADGTIEVGEDTGIVFVLVPGGSFTMGAQAEDPRAPHYDPATRGADTPPTATSIGAFLLARHELTQGQWQRLHEGDLPSRYPPGRDRIVTDLRHPVESVSWQEGRETLARYGLELPSSAMWEYACRAGTSTPWWPGADRESLRRHGLAANLADAAATRAGAKWPDIADWPDLDDGCPVHAPAGRFRANLWGFSEMHGNVSEWCEDPSAGGTRLVRGGNFMVTAAAAGSARVYRAKAEHRDLTIGLRAARRLR